MQRYNLRQKSIQHREQQHLLRFTLPTLPAAITGLQDHVRQPDPHSGLTPNTQQIFLMQFQASKSQYRKEPVPAHHRD